VWPSFESDVFTITQQVCQVQRIECAVGGGNFAVGWQVTDSA